MVDARDARVTRRALAPHATKRAKLAALESAVRGHTARLVELGTLPAKREAMGIVHDVSVAAGHALSSVHAGAGKLALHKLAEGLPPAIEVRSIAFEPGGPLPISCTVDGVGAPPPLSWHGAPEAASSVVVICEDPDAPALEPYLHWLVYGMPGSTSELDAITQHQFRLGENSKSESTFTPAAPPPGHGLHHYHFQVFALDKPIELDQGAARSDVLDSMQGHVLSWGELVGTYERD